jgi:hypothetical protein
VGCDEKEAHGGLCSSHQLRWFVDEWKKSPVDDAACLIGGPAL